MNPGLPAVPIPTTVVGSYPAVAGRGFCSLLDPMKAAVRNAVGDQRAAGIDIISDGQVRADMVTAFASRLPGITGQEVTGKVMPASFGITVHDTAYACTQHPFVKGILTGPSTLAHGLHLRTRQYRSREELVPDIALALAHEARELERAGVCMVQVDEPIFSTGAADLDTGREGIRVIAESTGLPLVLHACGSITAIADSLLAMPVDVLDLEFSKNPGNLEVMGRNDLKGKKIGLGCIDSTSDTIEQVPEIEKVVRRGVELFGPDRLLADPDCGLRMRQRDAAREKLSRMVEAVKNVRKDL
jgi:5-methyltetrahydropteroyltriglutamate--homocysteine methyltransferase